MRGRILTLIGADGAGKSTHARRLATEVDPPATYIYMGSNPSAATHALPTTRAWTGLKRALGRKVHHSGPPEPGRSASPGSAARRVAQHVKSLLVVTLRGSEELYRLVLAERLARRGRLVILDRHPYADYHTRRIDAKGQWLRWGDRVHAWLLEHVYPLPRELVLLDAPAEVLHARKPEGSLGAVRARRQEYLDLVGRLPPGVHVSIVDVSGPEDEVAAALLRLASGGGLARERSPGPR